MQLTRFTDLGLRIVVQLAAMTAAADTPSAAAPPRTTTAAVASALGASQTHVAKVVAKLADIGILRSTRGRTGGIYVTASALDYPLGQLVRELEGSESIPDNFNTHCPSDHTATFQLAASLMAAQNAFFDSLNSQTIRDILPEV